MLFWMISIILGLRWIMFSIILTTSLLPRHNFWQDKHSVAKFTAEFQHWTSDTAEYNLTAPKKVSSFRPSLNCVSKLIRNLLEWFLQRVKKVFSEWSKSSFCLQHSWSYTVECYLEIYFYQPTWTNMQRTYVCIAGTLDIIQLINPIHF